MITLGYVLQQWSDRQPEKEAFIFEDTRLTYGELNRRVNALCHAFLGFGLKKGAKIAVLSFNCHQFMEIFLACARAGMMLVPLNFRLVGRELEFQMNNSETDLLFLGEEFGETIQTIQAQLKTVKRFIVIGKPSAETAWLEYEQLVASYPGTKPSLPHDVDIQDEFLMIYTSGTTGRPKGAVLTQFNILFTSLNQIIDFRCTTDDITLTMAPMFHAAGSLILTFPMIHVGGTAVIIKHFDAEKSLKLIEKEKVTIIFAVPAMWAAIGQVPRFGEFDLSSLRFSVSGGSSQPVEEMKRFNSVFGLRLTEGYGLSEASSCSTMLMGKFVMEKAGSIGQPFLHNVVKVVNEKGEEVKPGEVGEIVQKDFTVMKGYYNLPEETSQAIVDGWLHTGDLATVDEEGFMAIKSRKKDMIVSGAENIYPVEIEQVLVDHPKIMEAAVFGIPDEKWGETVRAAVALQKGEEMTGEDVIDYCKQNLASYKKPTSVIFLDSLPRNLSGKVLKTELRRLYSKPIES